MGVARQRNACADALATAPRTPGAIMTLANHPSRPDRPWRSMAAMNEPREVDLGQFDYQARVAFRDLCRLHGFEAARQLRNADITIQRALITTINEQAFESGVDRNLGPKAAQALLEQVNRTRRPYPADSTVSPAWKIDAVNGDQASAFTESFSIDGGAGNDTLDLSATAVTGIEQQPGGSRDLGGANFIGRWTQQLAGGSTLQGQVYYDRVERDQGSGLLMAALHVRIQVGSARDVHRVGRSLGLRRDRRQDGVAAPGQRAVQLQLVRGHGEQLLAVVRRLRAVHAAHEAAADAVLQAEQPPLAAPRLRDGGGDPQQRRLSRPVGSHQPHDPSMWSGPVCLVEDDLSPEAFGDRLKREHGIFTCG